MDDEVELLMETTVEVEVDVHHLGDFEDGDVLVVHGMKAEDFAEFVRTVGVWLLEHGKRVMIINVPDGGELETLTEEGMNAAGWYRRES